MAYTGSIFLGNSTTDCGIIIRKANGQNKGKLKSNIYGNTKSDLLLVDSTDTLFNELTKLMKENDKNGFVLSVDTIIGNCKWYLAYAKKHGIATATQTTANSTARTPIFTVDIDGIKSATETVAKAVEMTKEQFFKLFRSVTDRLFNFFKEFEFNVGDRFVDTLIRVDNPKAYALNRLAIVDSPYVNGAKDKMNSLEFESILKDIATLDAKSHLKPINNRFEIFYGEPSGGKSTAMAKIVGDNRVIVCGASLTDEDIIKNFDFVDGKATFIESTVIDACRNGYAIGLDEINMLPFDTLRFLQTITDCGTEKEYKGIHFTIKDGFKIYGTMNLRVNGICYPLPEPLSDRASNIVEFALSPSTVTAHAESRWNG